LSGDKHHHGATQSPFNEQRRNAQETAELDERTRKLEALLLDKKLVAADTLKRLVETYENDIGPEYGAKVIARAWVDSAFKLRLLSDATMAIRELGYGGLQGEHMVVVENTADVHNVVVCSLCSCYPWPVLGLPPSWYKNPAYRSRLPIDPRGVLREFGLDLPQSVEVRVWDSSAEIRYLVMPERPAKTAHLQEENLAKLVTRDSMIGVAKANAPSE
jgi:nitrile hydratase subunit alpha